VPLPHDPQLRGGPTIATTNQDPHASEKGPQLDGKPRKEPSSSNGENEEGNEKK